MKLSELLLESSDEWIGVDLDGTLATYDKWKSIADIGEPIPKMVKLVKKMLADGKKVKIFTSRVSKEHGKEVPKAKKYIEDWCKKHLGQKLEVTSEKDSKMKEFYDDRAIGVEKNTGKLIGKNDETE